MDLELKTWESPRDAWHGPWIHGVRQPGAMDIHPPIHHPFIHSSHPPAAIDTSSSDAGSWSTEGRALRGVSGSQAGDHMPWAVNSEPEPARGCSSAGRFWMGGGWLRLYTIRDLAGRGTSRHHQPPREVIRQGRVHIRASRICVAHPVRHAEPLHSSSTEGSDFPLWHRWLTIGD